MLTLLMSLLAVPQDFTLPPGNYSAVVALELNAAGKVKGCKIAQSSGNSDADKKTCKGLMRNGQFEPALDAQGNAIPSTQTQTIRWRVPEPAY